MGKRTRIIQVDEGFKEMLERVMKEVERRRGRKPSYPELTAELSQKNMQNILNKMLFG